MDFDLTTLPVCKPPQKNIVLFGPSQPWKMNACLNFSGDMTHGYIEGYRKGAERLIEYVERTHDDTDYLIYPILFLYRHHLELRLKEILGQFHAIGSRRDPAPGGHSLSQLWSTCAPNLRTILGEEDKEWFNSVERCISQLHAIDQNSEDFRYPKRKDGTKSASELTHVNLCKLRDTMNSILDWLTGVSAILSDYRAVGE